MRRQSPRTTELQLRHTTCASPSQSQSNGESKEINCQLGIRLLSRVVMIKHIM